MSELYISNMCEAKEVVIHDEIREETIFEAVIDTKIALGEILEMLQEFSRQIESGPEKMDKPGIMPESRCFKDDICINKDLTFAIRGDLKRLISKFHP